jgi:hypothetical protein
LGPRRSREYLQNWPGTSVLFLMPTADQAWRMVEIQG